MCDMLHVCMVIDLSKIPADIVFVQIERGVSYEIGMCTYIVDTVLVF